MQLEVQVTRLDNGVRVASCPMTTVESVAIGVWVGIGGRYESARMSGVSHFIEHLLFKGTKTRSARDISQAIEGRGGYFNAFTQEESTCYYARVAAEHTWPVFDVLADMYRNPRFAPEDIAREKGVILEEISMYKDQPQHLVQEMLGELLWENHPLGRALIGTEKTIHHMSRADILSFKQNKYVPGNTVVVFAGKVDHQPCVEKVSAAIGSVRHRPVSAFKAATRGTGQGDVRMFAKDIEQTHIAMGVRLFGRHDSRRYTLKILSVILGENMSSRLFQVVREKHGLAYSVHSSVQLYDDTGVLDVAAGVDTKRMSKAIELIVSEIIRMKEQRVGAKELKRAKDYAIGQLRIGFESTNNRMMWIGDNLTTLGKIIQPAEVIRKVEAVTADDIRELARDIFRGRRTSLAMVAPGAGETHAAMARANLARLG